MVLHFSVVASPNPFTYFTSVCFVFNTKQPHKQPKYFLAESHLKHIDFLLYATSSKKY